MDIKLYLKPYVPLSGALTHLPDYVKSMGLELPFGVAEIGKLVTCSFIKLN